MSTSPISNLDDDSLFTIFDIFTRQKPSWEVRPLDTIRAASQVCSRWRGLCLSSPWIWGRAVDLAYATHGPKRQEWMEEVLVRAGSAPLWIYGEVWEQKTDTDRFDTYSFFVRLLASWERIERLVITMSCRTVPEIIETSFLSRAPLLKLFDVGIMGSNHTVSTDVLHPVSFKSLFANCAPSLQSIRAPNVAFAFKPTSPWLSNIREISPVPPDFSWEDICTLLQHAPVLECVRFDPNDERLAQERMPTYPKPLLPNLSSLAISSTLATGVLILDHLDNLSNRKLSTLRICLFGFTPAQADHSILCRWKEILPHFISNFFTWNPLTDLCLRISPNVFRICQIIQERRHSLPYFEVWVNTAFSEPRVRDAVTLSFLDTFQLSRARTKGGNTSLFSNVTKLTLIFTDISPSITTQLYAMLAGFKCIQTIETDEPSCQILWVVSWLDKPGGRRPRILFPMLHILQLFTRNSNDQKRYTGLSLFLMKRKNIGFPVAKLDLTACNKSYYGQDLRVLEQVAGLEVTWSASPVKDTFGTRKKETPEIYSYICGTGNPERLDGLISF